MAGNPFQRQINCKMLSFAVINLYLNSKPRLLFLNQQLYHPSVIRYQSEGRFSFLCSRCFLANSPADGRRNPPPSPLPMSSASSPNHLVPSPPSSYSSSSSASPPRQPSDLSSSTRLPPPPPGNHSLPNSRSAPTAPSVTRSFSSTPPTVDSATSCQSSGMPLSWRRYSTEPSLSRLCLITMRLPWGVVPSLGFPALASFVGPCGIMPWSCFGEEVWCDMRMNIACSYWDSLPTNFKQCRSLLSGLEGNVRNCMYAVEEDCRTTVWTYSQNDDGILDSFQPDKELQRKKKISYVRRRRDVSQAFGMGSEAEVSTVLSFGSLFTAPYKGSELYIDIKSPSNPGILSLLEKIEYLPFVPEIRKAGKDYAMNKIKKPFLCAQLRLLDGQFKNHWKTTFSALKQTIGSLQVEYKDNKSSGPINIFVMTDLPSSNWTGSYLADLMNDSDSFKLHTLKEGDDFSLQTAKNIRAAKHGLRSSFLPIKLDMVEDFDSCKPVLPDISLYLEETICSCASLGFVGTSGSTIAESIELMRKNNNCNMSSSS